MDSKTRRSPSASNRAPRPLHQAGGLFDKGWAGEEGFSPVTLNTPDIIKAIDASTLFRRADDVIPVPPEATSVHAPLPLVAGDDNADVSDASGAGEAFMEGFCDLSEYLAQGGSEPLPDMLGLSCLSGSAELDELLKRTLGDSLTTEASAPSLSQSPSAAVNTDHDSYTCNAKRRRASSTIDLDSSFGEPSDGKEKYHERRRKNNIASRRSRETRKQKFASMENKVVELTQMNAKLEEKVVELESLTQLMKSILVQKLSNKM